MNYSDEERKNNVYVSERERERKHLDGIKNETMQLLLLQSGRDIWHKILAAGVSYTHWKH